MGGPLGGPQGPYLWRQAALAVPLPFPSETSQGEDLESFGGPLREGWGRLGERPLKELKIAHELPHKLPCLPLTSAAAAASLLQRQRRQAAEKKDLN